MILLLAACVHRPPPPLLPDPPGLPDVTLRPRPTSPEGACRGEPVDPGVPVDCYGLAISVESSEWVELLEADVVRLGARLLEERDGRLSDRALHEDERLRLHRTVAELEAEARAARIAVPLAALGGGLAVGGLVYAGMRLGASVP